MPSTTLAVFVFVAGFLAGNCDAAEIKVNWRDLSSTKKEVTAGRKDTVVIDWSGTTNVHEVATKAEYDKCDGAFSVSRGGVRSPATLTVPATAADGEKFYYLSTVKDQCKGGKHLTITVSGGATLDAKGICADVACRKDNDRNKGFKLDPECCAFLGNPHHREEAKCADGYTYYQHKSDKCTPFGDLPRTATCCVRKDGKAPEGASLPTTPKPKDTTKALGGSQLTRVSTALMFAGAAMWFAHIG